MMPAVQAYAMLTISHVALLLAMPILLAGVVNRTKAWWGGRKGPPILQTWWDLRRLARKSPVTSKVASALFELGPWVVLCATGLAGLISPFIGAFAPLQFPYDFVLFAYVVGFGRLLLMLSAMDVGSSFEGMGAAREASFTVFIEPALFLLAGSAALATGQSSFAGLAGEWHRQGSYLWTVLPTVAVLLVLLQAEAARIPVDDPATHLELTMVHEVMLLDHSGPGLGAMQYAAAMKMAIYAGLIAALLNPIDPLAAPVQAVAVSAALMLAVAVVVGTVESLTARLRMHLVPWYLIGASLVAGMALFATAIFRVTR